MTKIELPPPANPFLFVPVSPVTDKTIAGEVLYREIINEFWTREAWLQHDVDHDEKQVVIMFGNVWSEHYHWVITSVDYWNTMIGSAEHQRTLWNQLEEEVRGLDSRCPGSQAGHTCESDSESPSEAATGGYNA